jgi:adenylate kinase
MNTTVLVFGVPGVGKSTACLRFVQRNPGSGYLSASKVLSVLTRRSVAELRAATREEVTSHQGRLATELKRQRDALSESVVLIDSQNVIDAERQLVRIPVEAIRLIEPTGLILLTAPPQEIFLRRRADLKIRPPRSIDEIAEMATIAREQLENYKVALGIPAVIANVGADFKLENAIVALSPNGV